MKIYTQAEFDALERDEKGYRICPTGDYSAIEVFGGWCRFGARCSFGGWCRFGEGCSFGELCSFGKGCSFGEGCIFGERCSFGEGCSFENVGEYVSFYPYVAFIGCGSRVGSKTYVYNLDRGIYVRCGCFLGTLAEFRERVRTENADPLYLDFVDLAERRLNEWRAEA